MAKQIRILPIAPDSANPATFNERADAFVKALQPFADDANALAKELEEFSANVSEKNEDANTKYIDLVAKYNDFFAKYADFFAKYDVFVPAYLDIKTKHGEVKTNKEHVDEIKKQIDAALKKATDMINENGIIDDSKTSSVSTFSSSKIDEDYVPKEKASADMKIYGKGIKQESENSSVVIRDDEGYILHTKPASAEFSSLHTLCVKGSDNKEKFATLETIYAKGLKELIGADFTEQALDVFDVHYQISASQSFKILKNGDVLFYGGKPKIYTKDFRGVSLANPSGSGSIQTVGVFNANKDVYAFYRDPSVLFKFIDNDGSYSWKQIALPDSTAFRQTQYGANKYFYILSTDGSGGKYYRLLENDTWEMSAINAGNSVGKPIHKDQIVQVIPRILIYDDFIATPSEILNINTLQTENPSFASDLRKLAEASNNTQPFFFFHNEFKIESVEGGAWRIINLKNNKAYSLTQRDLGVTLHGSSMLKKDGEYYSLGPSGVRKINKKLLKHYGVI